MKYFKLYENFTDDYLYHGTLVENEAEIKRMGLVPKIGHFVRNAYGDEYAAAGINIDDEEDLQLVFFADLRGLHKSVNAIKTMIAHKLSVDFHGVTPEQIGEHGLLLCIDNDGYLTQKAYGDDEDEEADEYGDFHPMTVEPGDFYSNRTVYGFSKSIKGQELLDFFAQHNVL